MTDDEDRLAFNAAKLQRLLKLGAQSIALSAECIQVMAESTPRPNERVITVEHRAFHTGGYIRDDDSGRLKLKWPDGCSRFPFVRVSRWMELRELLKASGPGGDCLP